MSRYHELLEQLRQAFPAPVSNPVHDGYVVFSLLKALDRVDALKTQAPILGTPRLPDYAAAGLSQLPACGSSLEEVIPELVRCLDGQLIFGHPRSQVNVVAHPSIASIIGVVLPSMYNPNLCSDETNLGFSEAEVRVAAMTAQLVGYDAANAGGLFTFGGTGTLLYGIKIGLEKAIPDVFERGLQQPAVVLCSQQSHYAAATAAGWLGLGQQSVVRVKTHPNNSLEIAALEVAFRDAHAAGQRIAAIVATMGTTDAFGVDDLAGIYGLRERLIDELKLDYRPHIHADAVIGWAWAVFNDYDFSANTLGFRGRTLRALAATQHAMQHLKLADSVGIDFHKTGFAPYISSLFLLRDRADFSQIVRDRATTPYLFHSGEYHPGLFSLETSRSATGVMAALANLLLLGREGFQTLIGHAVEMAELLREQIGARPELSVMNDQNYGPVTLFRAYPRGTDTFLVKQREQHDPTYREQLRQNNELNRLIYERVHAEAMAGRGVALGYTGEYRTADCGEPISALKSYVLSPFADEGRMGSVISHVLAAREQLLTSS
ncbi:L-2,4-diaminobutyrate decarboxylase [Anatilimnocola aggregata]|uniref:L-2,4-diaminobutyrate decarboxylase n=1 Tax=Anatilimnocola aggregata TaxID=2528021 RepID=A0A517YKG9_9BACT|nr:pyridoxal-dependent decarboxylase [Anatilimnocola aggregata]QDU30715.1 L-2,4-diaminobutyrate decarboxylase [Anatilimnocola aggregata]